MHGLMFKVDQSIKTAEKNTRGMASTIGRIVLVGFCTMLTMGEKVDLSLLDRLERMEELAAQDAAAPCEHSCRALQIQADAVEQDVSAVDSAGSTDSTNTAENSFDDYDGPDEMPDLDCSMSENFGLPECY